MASSPSRTYRSFIAEITETTEDKKSNYSEFAFSATLAFVAEIREFNLKTQIPAFNFFLGTRATGSLSSGSP